MKPYELDRDNTPLNAIVGPCMRLKNECDMQSGKEHTAHDGVLEMSLIYKRCFVLKCSSLQTKIYLHAFPSSKQNCVYSRRPRAATKGPAIPKVTPKVLAALVSEEEALAAAPVPVAVEPAADVVVDSTPDLVTANDWDWLMMPLLAPTLPTKLIW